MSFCDERPKISSTIRIVAVFVDSGGVRLAGLTPTVQIRCQSGDNAGKYWSTTGGGTWTATPAANYAMTPTNATYMPGHYYYDWTLPAAAVPYDILVDGGPSAANRYQDARVEAVAIAETDLALTGGDGDTLETLSDQLDGAATSTNVTDAVSAIVGDEADTLEKLSDQLDDVPVLTTAIDGTTTLQKALQVLLASCCGKTSVAGDTVTFMALDGTGTTKRLTVTAISGVRAAAVIDPP